MHFDKNVAMSLGVSLHVASKEMWQMAPMIQMIGPLSLLQYLKEETQAGGGELGLKWPNDVYYNGRKAAGTLTELVSKYSESSHDRVIFGMGINIANSEDQVEKLGQQYDISFLPASIQREKLAQGVYSRVISKLKLFQQKSPEYLYDSLSDEIAPCLLWVGKKVQLFPKGESKNVKPVVEGILYGVNKSAGVDLKAGKKMVQINEPMKIGRAHV